MEGCSLGRALKRDARTKQADRRARPRGGRRAEDLTNEEREERAKILAAYAAKSKKPGSA
jgi:hypothetical protein